MTMMFRSSLVVVVIMMIATTKLPFAVVVQGYGTSSSSYPKVVDRRSIAGLWSLRPQRMPLKEFTVRPTSKSKHSMQQEEEVLLMLKEDGSFQRYDTSDLQALQDQEETTTSLEDAWTRFRQQQKDAAAQKPDHVSEVTRHLSKGQWELVDGKLLLAADRPSTTATTTANTTPFMKKKTAKITTTPLPESRVGAATDTYDTLLVGRVVAQTRPSTTTFFRRNQPNATTTTTTLTPASDDNNNNKDNHDNLHLSVPMGSIKVGRFMYPKHHPSFFEQPMFQPSKKGSFTLRQVLGALSSSNHDDEPVEKFQRSDLYNRTFLLTSRPLQQAVPKGRPRWSMKQNKYVYDPPFNKKAAQAAQEAADRPVHIRVLQVRFYANNTFSTIPVRGSYGYNNETNPTILRGKFDVVGQDRDQLYMKISRFGFGRSVSGSVYSEGRMLSHDDAKTYWGTISYEDDIIMEQQQQQQVGTEIDTIQNATNDAMDQTQQQTTRTPDSAWREQDGKASPEQNTRRRLEVKGSVLFGTSLQPLPEARFVMREMTEAELLAEEEEEEDDDEEEEYEEEDEQIAWQELASDSVDFPEEEGVDWSNNDKDAFQ